MKKFLIIGIILFLAVTSYAADITITINAKRNNQLTKQAAKAGLTKEQFVRKILLDSLDANRFIRLQELVFQNNSSICATYDCDN